jgi:nucleoside-diphosphate-sugar epimerase
LHVSDAVRAIEAAVRVDNYSVINIGHPDIQPISQLAEMICNELGAPRHLIRNCELPARMTLCKRPVLRRQEQLLGLVPRVSLAEGVRRVCCRIQERLRQGERVLQAA